MLDWPSLRLKIHYLLLLLFGALLLGLMPQQADAYYVHGNSYWINTDASTEAQFRSCPARYVSSSQECTNWVPETIGNYTPLYYDLTHNWLAPGWWPDRNAAQAECDRHTNAMKAKHGPSGMAGGAWCFLKVGTRTVGQTCTNYQTNYTIGSCMSESQARSAGLGSYIDAQLATYNQPPTAHNKTLTIDQDTSGSVTVSGSDSDGYVSYYYISSQSPYGTASISGTTLTFTPSSGWSGTAYVYYVAVDNKGATSYPATVTVTVTPNKKPIADNKTLTIPQDGSGSVTVSGHDPDGTVASYAIYQQSPNGTATLSGTTLTFVPNPLWHGTATMTYRARDNKGAWSDPATVTITVTPNKKPITASLTLTTKEELPVSGRVSATDEDDPVPTVFQIVQQSEHGTVTLAGDVVTFQPNPDYHGTTSFTYRAQDKRGAWSEPATVTVVVTERKVVLSEFVYNSPTRSGSVKAVGIDEVPQAGVVKLLDDEGATVYEVAATRNEVNANTAIYNYDLRNASSGTYTLRAEVKDQLGGVDYLDYGEITIYIVKTVNFEYDSTHRTGTITVEDKGEILSTVLVQLFDESEQAYVTQAACTAQPEFMHSCAFDLNEAPEGRFDLMRVILIDNFDFEFKSDHGEVIIDKTAAQIESNVPTDGKVGAISDLFFTIKDNFDPRVTITSLKLTGGADELDMDLNFTWNGDKVIPEHFVMFPSEVGDKPYQLTIHTIDHQLNQSSRIVYFTFDPTLMELVVDLSMVGLDGRLGIPAVPFEFVRQGNRKIIETKEVKRRNGQLLEGQHDVYVTMHRGAQYPLRINGVLVNAGETVKIINKQNFDVKHDLSISIAAEVIDGVDATQLLFSIAAPDSPILLVPIYTWKGDVNLQSNRWEFRQVIDPVNIMAMPGPGVPCRLTVDTNAARQADPVADPVCLVEWTATPDESEMSSATSGGLRVAALVGQALHLGQQKVAYDLFIYSGDGTKVKIGSGERNINVVSAYNSVKVQPDRIKFYRLIDDVSVKFIQSEGPACNLTLNANQAINNGARSGQATSYVRDCLFEWTEMAQGLMQDPRTEVPNAIGAIEELGEYTFGWRLSTYSRNGTRITLADQTGMLEAVDPPAPEVTVVSNYLFNNENLLIPLGMSYPGDAQFFSEPAPLRVTVQQSGGAAEAETYPRRPEGKRSILRRLNVRQGKLWEESTLSLRAAYDALPSVFTDKEYKVFATPPANIVPFIEADSTVAIDTEPMRLRVRIGDQYNIHAPYDVNTMGEWQVRVLAQEGRDEPQPVSDWTETEDGAATFDVDLAESQSKSIKLLAQARVVSPVEGYERIETSPRPVVISILYGGAIEGDVTVRSISGTAPFNAVFKLVLAERDMQASTGEVVWETSLDGMQTWEPYIPSERYRFQYSRTFEKGIYYVRAKMKNRYSDIENYTETIRVVAYDKPVIDVEGPTLLFAGATAEFRASTFLEHSVINPETRRTDKVRTPFENVVIEWSLDGGKTWTHEGTTLAIESTEPKRYAVWARVREDIAPAEDRNAWTTVKKSLEFKEVRPPRIRLEGTNVVEVGKNYQFRATVSLPYNNMSEIVEGEFTLPDGTVVQGFTANYTPTDADLQNGQIVVKYDARIVGWEDAGAVASATRTARIWKYEWPEFSMEVRSDTEFAPATLTLRVRSRTSLSHLENPTYQWIFPSGGVLVTQAGSPTQRQIRISEAGKHPLQVLIRDARGNETLLEEIIDVKQPAPYKIDLKYTVSNTAMRNPLEILIRPEITGGHPRDRVASRSYSVNSIPAENAGLYGRAILGVGEHTVRLDITSEHGVKAHGEVVVTVHQNEAPVCTLTSREAKTALRVDADCRDVDGRISTYQWWVNGKQVGVSSKTLSITVKQDEPLPTVTVVAVDDAGDRSQPVSINSPTQ